MPAVQKSGGENRWCLELLFDARKRREPERRQLGGKTGQLLRVATGIAHVDDAVAAFSTSWNGVSLVARVPRRYFGSTTIGATSHLATVLRDSLVVRALSRSEFFPRLCIRRICQSCPWWSLLFLGCVKKQQSRLNTRLDFGSAYPSKVAQFSVGANRLASLEVACRHAHVLPEPARKHAGRREAQQRRDIRH